MYPSDDPTDDIDGSTEAADVSFVTDWPDSGYPGAAECHIMLQDITGATVGKLDFELNSGTDRTVTDLQVPVSGTPVSGSGLCADLAADVPGGGYIFGEPTSIVAVEFDLDDPRIEPGEVPPSRSEITFDVRLETEGADAEFRTCFLVVTRSDGFVDEPLRWDILGGGGGPMTFEVEGVPESIADAQMTCEPLREGTG